MGYAYLRHTDPYDGMTAKEAGIYDKSAGKKMAARTKTYERKTSYNPNNQRVRFIRKR